MSIGKAFLAGLGVELDEAAQAPARPEVPIARSPASMAMMQAPVAVGATLAPADQENFDAISKQIFPAPDNYTLFRDFHQELGGNDIGHTLAMLMKANPGISVPKIKADISMALDRVQQQRQQFGQEIDRAKKTRVDAVDAENQRLTDKMVADNNEVNRLKAEIASAQQQITANQTQKQQAQAAIADGQTHFEAVVQRIEQPLQQAQTIFSNIQ